ncbi:MAG: DMT family transporter [Xanthomonadales bacterium]|nr:DMT family transporter [Xanthomonadales bacterium]
MSDSTDQRRTDRVVLGMSAALAAFFLFTLMNVFAKLLAERHSVIEIAFYRNLIALLPFLVMLGVFGKRQITLIRAKPFLVILRAVLGAVSLMITFAAFSLMPMADTTVLLFTSSLFIPVLGMLILKESVGPWRWSAVLIGFLGVAIMAQPGGQVVPLGIGLALGAALLHATLQIVLRYLGRYERPETITFYFFLIGTVVSALPLPWLAVMPSREEIPWLLGVGLSGAGAQWCLTVAFRHAQASIVTVFNYSGIVWATLFGWLIWGEFPLPVVMIGATIVVLSNAVVIWREARQRRITGARVRAKL